MTGPKIPVRPCGLKSPAPVTNGLAPSGRCRVSLKGELWEDIRTTKRRCGKVGDWTTKTTGLVAHWEAGDGLDHEGRIQRLEQEVRLERESLANTLKAAIALAELVEKLSDTVAAQAQAIEGLKEGHGAATGLLDERTGDIVGLTWPAYRHTPARVAG